jgi:hypothetical protein
MTEGYHEFPQLLQGALEQSLKTDHDHLFSDTVRLIADERLPYLFEVM